MQTPFMWHGGPPLRKLITIIIEPLEYKKLNILGRIIRLNLYVTEIKISNDMQAAQCSADSDVKEGNANGRDGCTHVQVGLNTCIETAGTKRQILFLACLVKLTM
jgi:hypothetical protein